MESFQLIPTVCMLSNQLSCEEQRFPFDSDGSAIACARAQSAIAGWVSDHPGWVVKRWTCDSPTKRKQDT